MQEPTPLGHVPNMTNEAYHAAPGISKSHLDAIANQSPMHYWAQYIDPNRVHEMTEAMSIGQAAHYAILEPDLLLSKVACIPDVDGRTKEGKAIKAAFALEHAGKLALKYNDYQGVLGLRDACMKNATTSGLLARGQSEQTFFATDPETGALIKCRTDYIHDDMSMIIDVKSAEDASPWGFGKAAGNYRYDVQAPWYTDVVALATGVRPQHFVWVAFEKVHPYAIGVYYAAPEQIERARAAARADLVRILHYRKENVWPDYSQEIRQLQLPAWVKR